MSRDNPWLAFYRPRSGAQIRLFCFPYAGGSARAYRNWPDLLPPTIEVCAVELPGRGHRFSSPPRLCLDTLVQEMLAALQPMFDRPWALFGHSLGAVLAYEVARRQAVGGGALPRRLFISGQRAPHRPDPKPPLHRLPEDELLKEIRKLGGTPPEVFAQPELLDLFIPILRADFEMGETFTYTIADPLPCPISAFGGTEDPEISDEDVANWERYTGGGFRIRRFPGDHFFLHQCEAEVIAAIVEDLCGSA